MPALEACGRVWELGSDDLFFPGLASAIIHGVWLLGLLAGALYFREALLCEPEHYLAGLALSLIIVTILGVMIEVAISVVSARGTIVHVRPRRYIVVLLYAKILTLAIEFVLLIIGTVFVSLFHDEVAHSNCAHIGTAAIMIEIVIGLYWFVFFLYVLVALIYLDPCHCYSAKVNYHQVTTRIREEGPVDQEVVEMQWNLVHTLWEKRFRVLCCAAGSDDMHQLAYKEVAEIFAHLFCDTNVVMSDIVAGLILLQKEHLTLEGEDRKQRRHFRERSFDVESPPYLSFDFNHQEDRDTFRDAMHFVKYALGMYTWPIYVYMNPFCGLCRLYDHLNCCRHRRNEPAHIRNDNWCSCHLGGLQQFTGLHEMDIICLSFENDVYMVPYMVCLDHETKSVVVAFRGTFSFGDMVTDLTASTRPMELPNYPNFLVHKGMLKTVTAILEKMDAESILESAFSRVPGYSLVVVGHSLGSGCACVFSILLRERYPDVRCFCYSPTGALLNEAAAVFTEDFVTSVTLGMDLVARLNVPNTHRLKEDLVRVIESCRKPKCRILMEGCLETLCTCFGASLVFDPPTNRNAVPASQSTTNTADATDDAAENSAEHFGDGDNGREQLITINIDPEESLLGQSHHVATLSGNRDRGSGHRNPEIAPILRPQLSSLKLPVRSANKRGVASPTSSLTQEVERRLVALYPPGKIIHIVDRSKIKPCFCASRQLVVTWASRHDFNQISVSPDMVRDHFPDVLYRAMRNIWTKKLEEFEDRDY